MVGRRVLFAICGTILAGCGASKPKPFGSAVGRFSAEMPATMKETEQSIPTAVGPIPAHLLMGEDADRVIFGVTYADLPANLIQPGDTNASLEGSVNGMIAASQATRLDKRPIMLGPHQGREVRFEVHPAGMSEKGLGVSRIYLVGNRSYQLMTLGSESKFREEVAKAFFDSFRLEDGTTSTLENPADAATSTGWGTPDHPGGDCRIQVQGPAATIEVLGTRRIFTPGLGGVDNTPKLMRPIEGDFVAAPRAEGAKVSFLGARLVFRGESGDIMRVKRAAILRNGRVRTYVLFKHHRAGQTVLSQETDYPGGAVWVRMERRPGHVTGLFSLDGTDWSNLGSMPIADPRESVVVAAINMSNFPFLSMFEGLKVNQP